VGDSVVLFGVVEYWRYLEWATKGGEKERETERERDRESSSGGGGVVELWGGSIMDDATTIKWVRDHGLDHVVGDTEPNSLSLSLSLSLYIYIYIFSLWHRLSLNFSLNLRLFLTILVTIQCETNGRGDASVVLKKKMKKGVLGRDGR
jgi:hypothetical protein